jgi:hypothetical protein
MSITGSIKPKTKPKPSERSSDAKKSAIYRQNGHNECKKKRRKMWKRIEKGKTKKNVYNERNDRENKYVPDQQMKNQCEDS